MNKELYQLHLEHLDKSFPGPELLTRKEVQQVVGLSRPAANRLITFEGKYISKVNLAKQLTEMGRQP